MPNPNNVSFEFQGRFPTVTLSINVIYDSSEPLTQFIGGYIIIFKEVILPFYY